MSNAVSPYALLGVDKDADDGTIQRSYEARLAEASRHGAVRHATELVEAHAVLSDRRRRDLYDRHGVDTPLARLHPLQRYAPRAVPFRQWSPAEGASRPRSPECPQSSPRPVLVVVAVSVGISLAVAAAGAALESRDRGGGQPEAPAEGQVTCQVAPELGGYTYQTVQGSPLVCDNGAAPAWSPR